MHKQLGASLFLSFCIAQSAANDVNKISDEFSNLSLTYSIKSLIENGTLKRYKRSRLIPQDTDGTKMLNLNRLKIESLHGLEMLVALKLRPQIEHILLGYNQIKEISSVFSHFPNVRIISLCDNQIMSIDPNAFTGLKQLRDLNILRNKLPQDEVFTTQLLAQIPSDCELLTDHFSKTRRGDSYDSEEEEDPNFYVELTDDWEICRPDELTDD